MLASIIATAFVFTSCTKDEEYNPQIASSVSNSLCVSIIDENSDPLNIVDLLASNEVSVYEINSKRNAKIDVIDYEGTKCLRFRVELPDKKSMSFNEDRSAGTGKVNLMMNVKGTQLPISVNFVFTSTKDTFIIGGNSISIKSIEYDCKTIVPTEKLNIYSIRIKLDGKKTTIDPLS